MSTGRMLCWVGFMLVLGPWARAQEAEGDQGGAGDQTAGIKVDEAKPEEGKSQEIRSSGSKAGATKPEEVKAPEPATPALTLDAVKKFLGLSVFLQGSYQYDFQDPDLREASLRVFDNVANSFVLDLAEIQLQREAQRGEVGFKLKLTAGETAKWIHSRGLGTDEFFDVTEGFVEYSAPLGNGLKIRFGKFMTYFLAEVLEARDNPNTSRSFLFNYGAPVTHTGFMIGYSFAESLTVNLFAVNGWNNTADNNQGKTFGLSIAYNPAPQLSATFNAMFGPEQDGNNDDNRLLLDLIVTAKPIEMLTLIANGTYGRDHVKDLDVEWHGVTLVAKVDPLEWMGVALRGEFYKDRDGYTTGTAQELKELTFTLEFRLPGNLLLRPEYRHDWSTQPSFHNHWTQDTLGVAAMFTW